MTAQIIPFPLDRRLCGDVKGLFRCDLRTHPDRPDAHRYRSPAESARLSEAADKIARRPADRYTLTKPKGPTS